MGRQQWEFEYPAPVLCDGATRKLQHRRSRLQWWEAERDRVMDEVRKSGLEVRDAVVSMGSSQGRPAQVSVRQDLQARLGECQEHIRRHTEGIAEYEGWVQVLNGNLGATLKTTYSDWLYFLGRD